MTSWISKNRVAVTVGSVFIVLTDDIVTLDSINPSLGRHLLASKIDRIHFGEVRSELGQGLAQKIDHQPKLAWIKMGLQEEKRGEKEKKRSQRKQVN